MPYVPEPGDVPFGRIDENGEPDGFVRDGQNYLIRKPFVLEFFAYETVGFTPAHVGSVVKTDDPAVMQGIVDAEKEGRITIDEHGSVTFVEPPDDAGVRE